MSSRSRLTASGLTLAALAVSVAACGGATVEGEAPEVSTQATAASTASSAPFADERPEKPTGPVPPPPVQSPAPEPMPGEPAPETRPGADTPAPAEPGAPATPAPGGGDFAALIERRGVTLPEGMDPVDTATQACGRFDNGEQMVDVTRWLGEVGGLDPDQQGFFLGAAVGTYCPQNFPKLG